MFYVKLCSVNVSWNMMRDISIIFKYATEVTDSRCTVNMRMEMANLRDISAKLKWNALEKGSD